MTEKVESAEEFGRTIFKMLNQNIQPYKLLDGALKDKIQARDAALLAPYEARVRELGGHLKSLYSFNKEQFDKVLMPLGVKKQWFEQLTAARQALGGNDV